MSTTTSPGSSRNRARFAEILDRLTTMSERDYYNPYQVFQWPASLPEDGYWMSPELLTIHGTEVWDRLSEPQRRAVSKWESINFYSLNVHGIRELLQEVVARIHTRGFELPSKYFHHIIGEENEHMWFFATFCLKYGGKIYPDKTMRFNTAQETDAANFLVFSRLLIFEEIVDFYNKKMGTDERLHPTIRQVNDIHHTDESRHIAFGRQMVSLLHAGLRETHPDAELQRLERYLKDYMRASVESLCNPAAYRDAGLDDPYGLRREVVASPGHRALQERALKRTVGFMVGEGIFGDAEVVGR